VDDGSLKGVLRDPQVFAEHHIALIRCFLDPADILYELGLINSVPLIHRFQPPTCAAKSIRDDLRAKASVHEEP
jgi:hypothetical protein